MAFSTIKSMAISMLLLLQFLQSAQLLQSHVFFLLPPSHLETELVLSENTVHSWLLYHHMVSFSEFPIAWIVPCYVSELFSPVLAVWLRRRTATAFWRWRRALFLLFLWPLLLNMLLFSVLLLFLFWFLSVWFSG